MNITKIKGISNCYPEIIVGTNEWYSCSESKGSFCDLYEAEEIINSGKVFQGMNCHLIHFPSGKVYSPFKMQENVYVEKPIWNNGELNFLVINFNTRLLNILKYIPEKQKLERLVELSLSEVKDCYNLKLEIMPLTLGRSGNDGFYQIIWPEKKNITIGETETVLFRDGDKLYLSEWYENPEYHENVIVRDIRTGKIIEKSEGYLCRLANNVYWKI
ncbi:MAG: hypothetical protein E7216_02735 [Clostridium thermopalmarium]|nr:hypothetical protein [Clostridium thermopalmarium]